MQCSDGPRPCAGPADAPQPSPAAGVRGHTRRIHVLRGPQGSGGVGRQEECPLQPGLTALLSQRPQLRPPRLSDHPSECRPPLPDAPTLRLPDEQAVKLWAPDPHTLCPGLTCLTSQVGSGATCSFSGTGPFLVHLSLGALESTPFR